MMINIPSPCLYLHNTFRDKDIVYAWYNPFSLISVFLALLVKWTNIVQLA